MSHQRHQSIGSSISDEDEFDLLRTSQEEDAEVSVASSSKRPPPSRAAASYTAKTPMMKTPSMDALTRKYEFLLKNDKSTNSKSAAGTWSEDDGAYFSTPTRPSADPHRLTRVQSYGSRNSSRSNTPTRQQQPQKQHQHSPMIVKPVFSASKIKARLHSSEAKGNASQNPDSRVDNNDSSNSKMMMQPPHSSSSLGMRPTPPSFRSPSSFDRSSIGRHNTGTQSPGQRSPNINDRYRSDLRQNLEKRLKDMDKPRCKVCGGDHESGDHNKRSMNEDADTKSTGTGTGEHKKTPPRITDSLSFPEMTFPSQQARQQRLTPFSKAFTTTTSSSSDEEEEEEAVDLKPKLQYRQAQPTSLPPQPKKSTNINATTANSPTLVSDMERREKESSSEAKPSSQQKLTDQGKQQPQPPQSKSSVSIPILPNPADSSKKIPLPTLNVDIDMNNNPYDIGNKMDPATPVAIANADDGVAPMELDFWHRWKMAEQRMQQQQQQFEQEKVEWVRQLESAYDANSQVEALAKRMEVQLLAVHKTCLREGEHGDDVETSDSDELDDLELKSNPTEVPLDPLHLLMLREESGDLLEKSKINTVEDFNKLDADESGADDSDDDAGATNTDKPNIKIMASFEYTDRLERKLARTRTKNVILSHLVKLLERQAHDEKRDLEQQLKMEKEERQELWGEVRQLEQRLLEQQPSASASSSARALAPSQSGGGSVSSSSTKGQAAPPRTPPTERDQYKALQQHLWLREQQVKSLQDECDRYKQLANKQQTADSGGVSPSPSKQRPASNDKNVTELQMELQSVIAERENVEQRCEDLQSSFDQLEMQVVELERSHEEKLSSLEEQLEMANNKVQLMEAKAKALEEQQERKDRSNLGSVTANMIARMEKQREMEQKKLTAQLNSLRADADNYRNEISRLKSDLQEARKRADSGGSISLAEMQEVEEKHEQEVQELAQQLEVLGGECDQKDKTIASLREWLDDSTCEVQRLQQKAVETAEERGSQLTQLEGEVTRLEFSLQVERQNVEEAKEEISRLEGVVDQLYTDHEQEIYKLEEQMKSEIGMADGVLEGKCEDLENQLREVTNELENVTAELEQCMASLEAESSKCLQVAQRNTVLELEVQQLKHLEARNAALDKELEELDKKNSDLEGNLSDLQKRSAADKEELETRCNSLAAKHASDEEVTRQLGYLSKQNGDLLGELESVTSELDTTITLLQTEESKSRHLEEGKAALDKELGELSKKNSGLEKDLSDLQSRSAAEKEELETRCNSLAAKHASDEEVTKQLEYLSKQNEDLLGELESTKSEHRTTNEALQHEKVKSTYLEEQLSLLNKELEEVNNKNTGIGEALADLNRKFTNDKEELENRCNSLTSELREVQNELKTTTESLQNEVSKSKNMEELNRRLTGDKEELEARCNSLTSELWEAQNSLREKNEQQVESEESDRRELEKSNSQLNEQLQSLNDRFISEMKEMESRYKSLLSEKDGTHGELTKTNDSLENQISSLQGELQSLRSDSGESARELQEMNSSLEHQVQELMDQVRSLRSENDKLEEDNKSFEHQVEQLKRELEVATEGHDQLQETNENLNAEFAQLNERFVTKTQELQIRYQTLNENSNEKEESLRAKILELESQNERNQTFSSTNTELAKKCESLEAKVAQLEKALDVSSSALEVAVAANNKLERQVEDLSERESHHLASCESNDSVRTQELIEEKTERERQLEEARKELDNGLKALRQESEKYRVVVEKNISLVLENKQLKLEQSNWESTLQTTKEEGQRERELLVSQNEDLRQQVEQLKDIHENALAGWRKASEQSNKETEQAQNRLDVLLSEKQSLQSQLAAAEREIETMQKNHERNKQDWKDSANFTSQNAVDELKREVQKMGEQIGMSNATIQELATKQSDNDDVLSRLDRMHRDMEDIAAKLALESTSIAESRDTVLQRLTEVETVTGAKSDQSALSMEQHRVLLEQIMDTCVRSEAAMATISKVDVPAMRTPNRKVLEDRVKQYEAELQSTKEELEKTAIELEAEVDRRNVAEYKVSVLQDQVANPNNVASPPKDLFNDNRNQSPVQVGLDSFAAESTLDQSELEQYLAELGEKIESEMKDIRGIGKEESGQEESVLAVETTSYGDDEQEESDELVGARQAMFAQSLTVVQCLRSLLVQEEDADEEEQSGAVFQHLETLSELIGEVEQMETAGPAASSLDSQVLEASVPGESSSKDDEEGNDLLRFELEQEDQDDTMLDLLNDVSLDQSNLAEQEPSSMDCTAVLADDNMLSAIQKYPPSAGGESTSTASPIELVVEQTYNRCQVLERERCDLINTTLDLLSASREANKAEIDAAIASARRKAAEEMIAMKKETQAQVDQIWWRLCDKCRHGLVQG